MSALRRSINKEYATELPSSLPILVESCGYAANETIMVETKGAANSLEEIMRLTESASLKVAEVHKLGDLAVERVNVGLVEIRDVLEEMDEVTRIPQSVSGYIVSIVQRFGTFVARSLGIFGRKKA